MQAHRARVHGCLDRAMLLLLLLAAFPLVILLAKQLLRHGNTWTLLAELAMTALLVGGAKVLGCQAGVTVGVQDRCSMLQR